MPSEVSVEGYIELRTIVTNDKLVKSVEYFVDAESIGSSEQDFYSLTWDSYYFSDSNTMITISTLLTDVNDNVIFGPSLELQISSESNKSLQLEITDGQAIRNNNQITLAWTELTDVDKYHVQLWSVEKPNELTVDKEVMLPELLVEKLSVGEYIWRVKAKNQFDNWGAWTVSQSFLIAGPQAPELVSPQQNDKIEFTYSPQLEWASVSYAEVYLVQVAKDENFIESLNNFETIDTNYVLDSLELGKYYWRVRSQNELGYLGEWSNASVFNITGPLPPTGLSPSGEASVSTHDGVLLAWEGIENYKYEIEVDLYSNFPSPASYSNLDADSQIITHYRKGKNWWRIRSIDPDGNVGVWSQAKKIMAYIAPIPQNATRVLGSTNEDMVWKKENSPYYISGNTNLYGSLTIEPGITLLFDNDSRLEVHGLTIIRGTNEEKIILTSAFEIPQVGDWQQIHINNGLPINYDNQKQYISGNIIQHAEIKFGGMSPAISLVEVHGGIYFDSNEIINSLSKGLYVSTERKGVVVSRNIISNNGDKYSTYGGAGVSIIETGSGGNPPKNHISYNIIDGNQSRSNGSGLYLRLQNNFTVVNNNIFRKNLVLSNILGEGGGAIYILIASTLTIVDNVFEDNSTLFGADIFSSNGESFVLKSNTFKSNETSDFSIVTGRKTFLQKFSDNNFFGYEKVLKVGYLSNLQIDAQSNWWDNLDPFEIENLIFHEVDDVGLGAVLYNPILISPSIVAPISPPENVRFSIESNIAKISWDMNLGEDVAGYRIYIDDGHWPFDEVIDVGNALVYNLDLVNRSVPGFVGVTSYDTNFSLLSDDPLIQINENQMSGFESLITEVSFQ